MNHLSHKFIVTTALMAMYATPELTLARGAGGMGGAARGAVAGAVASKNVGASLAAQSSADAAAQSDNPDQKATPVAKTAAPATPACPPPPALMTGSYMGAQLGYGTYHVVNNISLPAGMQITSKYPAAASNWAAGVFIGYGKLITTRFYLGGELFINANNGQQDFAYSNYSIPTTYTNETRIGVTSGIALLPGVRFTETTLNYIRLGWNRTEFDSNETVTKVLERGSSKVRSGFVFGVGMETLISTNYSLRGEFDHTNYSSYNTYGIYNTRVKPSNNQFMMSIIYHAG